MMGQEAKKTLSEIFSDYVSARAVPENNKLLDPRLDLSNDPMLIAVKKDFCVNIHNGAVAPCSLESYRTGLDMRASEIRDLKFVQYFHLIECTINDSPEKYGVLQLATERAEDNFAARTFLDHFMRDAYYQIKKELSVHGISPTQVNFHRMMKSTVSPSGDDLDILNGIKEVYSIKDEEYFDYFKESKFKGQEYDVTKKYMKEPNQFTRTIGWAEKALAIARPKSKKGNRKETQLNRSN